MQAYSYGYIVPITTNLDLSAVTDLRLLIRVPGAVAPLNISVPLDWLDPSTGTIHWPVAIGQIAAPGTYKAQLLDQSGGKHVFSAPQEFEVAPNIAPGV